uniref:4-hydroxythreonine-4-phosphate dehydrogenase n=1 Tax=Candidatus Aschnera chinzeii TaxID=1485666 RepID=A0AAT9G3S1_9ENTR|nr:MAG: 4-hydroxythreonine-4-phosphate dehydrogenase PdxA [Candidatus Aschnera chinzeii]
MNSIILTAGEPAGIGPDLLVHIAQQQWPIRLVACVDPQLLLERAKILNLKLNLITYDLIKSSNKIQDIYSLFILPIKLTNKVKIGTLDKNNSNYVIQTLSRACDGCISGEFSGLVTGPINKKIINDAGIYFSGHTEFLTHKTQSKQAVMMLTTNNLRVALATTHIPLNMVSNAINKRTLKNTIFILNTSLKKYFNIKNPNIYICGLNPHAGENGYIGTEEKNIIIPLIKELNNYGLQLSGPFPADSIFQKKYLKKADVILTMYHDQGLPVIKSQSLGTAVNITLGLPFIRTSVDHGTALQLAGTNQINTNSFFNAIKLLIKILSSSNE